MLISSMAEVYGPRGLFLISLLAFSLGFLELYYLTTGRSSGLLGWVVVALMLFAGVYYVWLAYSTKNESSHRTR